MFGFDGTARSYTVDSRTNAACDKWQATLDEKLLNSFATIQLQSLGPTNPVPPMVVTRSIRVVVTVEWDEGTRHRTARLGTVRM
jgi:hypothetical protein